jgi:diguanylate cyclase (GGDEF)-like protein
VLGLAALATFALWTQHRVVDESRRADAASRLATVYQDARFWVGQDESLERKYRVEPTQMALDLHEQSGDNLIADLRRVAALDPSPAVKRRVALLLQLHVEYERATARMFSATRSGNTPLVRYLDHHVTDPIFGVIQEDVYGAADEASRNALGQSAALRRDESSAFNAWLIALGLAIGLVGAMGLVIRRDRRARRRMRAAELLRLSEMVITDPLTGLRNHRAFHEDLEQEILRTARTGVPMALVLLDVDAFKAVNDTFGHQAGDEHLKALGRAILATRRGSDRAYRIGGDEFAVVLPSGGEWAGFQFAQRLRVALGGHDGHRLTATAGVSQALELRPKANVIRDADLALISAKRSGQAVAVYTPEMRTFEATAPRRGDERHTRTLAHALALAVDAKDPETEGHSQTVANLCALIAAELGLDPDRLGSIRLAGLLHDVGKIGIPDAILHKTAELTAAEYEQMKTHVVLGESIVLAADMPEVALWVRHHHERVDGGGYPDGLAGSAIPLESRIVHVADAFEAMTADRPYRKAPGERFALEELRRHAGTQFDSDVVDALLCALGAREASPSRYAPTASV